MTIDPTKIQIESQSPPIWEHEEDFGQIMSDQIRHAPWLVLSVLAHVIAGFILYFALDSVRMVVAKKFVAVEQQEDPLQIIDEPDIPPETVPDEIVKEVDFNESLIDEVVDRENVVDESFEQSNVTAFDNKDLKAVLGLGPGPGGRWGRRGGRPPGRHDRKKDEKIRRALGWLVRHQDEDGRWDADGFMKHDTAGTRCDGAGNPVHDVGVTALALLAFLGDGHTMRSGRHKDTVKKAVIWLRKQQGKNGMFGMNASHDFIYDHAIASYAMCEAYGLSSYRSLRKNAQMGINYLESHRNPYGCWRYQPRDNDNDISVTGWCIMAYKSAKDFGLDVSTTALKASAAFIDELTDPVTGRTGYTKRGELSSRHPGDHAKLFPIEKGEAMTAVGLFCRFFLGQDPKRVATMKLAADTLLQKPPVWDKQGSVDHYYWYYATYALYQMGGKWWDQWQKKLTKSVVNTQREDGNFRGSWDATGAWGEDGGRVYSTAILALTLEAYYRYTRLVR